MEEKKSFGSKLEAFFAGKGFYIVLLLCVTVIGVSAWSMLNGGEETPTQEDFSVAAAGMQEGNTFSDAGVPVATRPPLNRENAVPVPSLTPVPAPTPTPVSSSAPEATPASTATPVALPAAAMSPPPTKETSGEVPAIPAAAVSAGYFVWPVIGEAVNGYAMTSLTYDRTMRDWRTHDGIDVAAALGTRVRAASGGVVAEVLEDSRYGVTVVLDHGDGLCSVYANLAGTPAVSAGEAVAVGQVIGSVGNTALCEIGEVSHLHFAMTRNGESVDPGEFLP